MDKSQNFLYQENELEKYVLQHNYIYKNFKNKESWK